MKVSDKDSKKEKVCYVGLLSDGYYRRNHYEKC